MLNEINAGLEAVKAFYKKRFHCVPRKLKNKVLENEKPDKSSLKRVCPVSCPTAERSRTNFSRG